MEDGLVNFYHILDAKSQDNSAVKRYIQEFAKEANFKTCGEWVIQFVKEGETFELITSQENILGNKLNPVSESEGREYSNLLSWKGKIIRGFYTGSSSDWLPVLIADNYIDESRFKDYSICTISVEKDSPIILMERHKNMGSGISVDLCESFIVSDQQAQVIVARPITTKEIKEALEIVKSWDY